MTRLALVKGISEGKIVASCRGRMEFGPRALGSRSLLLSGVDPGLGERLNRSLGRDPLMPFGPVLTAEAAPKLLRGWGPDCVGLTGLMTVALPASGRLKSVAPGAVHRDGTARAQVIERSFDPDLYSLLEGLPGQVCINTSLNLHGEPIVSSTDEAVRAAESAGASVLWLD